MELPVYNQEGKETGKMTLPESVFGVSWNGDLVHQVVTSMFSNARTPIAHTKGRGEVSGGGKKPWRQKGTGRARHGSIRSPIWVKGGVAHGPTKEKNYSKKINKQMKTAALRAILSQKAKEGEVLLIDSLSLSEPKTKEAKKVLSALGGIKGFERMPTARRGAFIALPEKNENAKRGFRNFGNISVSEIASLNPVDALNFKYLVIASPTESLKILLGRGVKK